MSVLPVAAVEGTDFIALVDESTWEEWDLSTRTLFILWSYRKWVDEQVEEGAAPRTFEDGMMTAVTTPRLRRLISRAWQGLPQWERSILQVMNVKFAETDVKPGALAACETVTAPAWGLPPAYTIQLDPAKYGEYDDELLLHAIYHELAHVAYRTSEFLNLFTPNSIERMQPTIESFCDAMGFIWLTRAGDYSHNDAGQAGQTAVTEPTKNGPDTPHEKGGDQG